MSTEHIPNEAVPFYFDSCLSKLSKELEQHIILKNYSFLDEDAANIAFNIFKKFEMHFYSTVYLNHNPIHTPSEYYLYDICSVPVLERACYELYLLFNYIYMLPNYFGDQIASVSIPDSSTYLSSIHLKLLLYKYDSYSQQYKILSKEENHLNDDSLTSMNIAELQKTSLQNEIYDHPLFASFTEHNKKQLMKKGHPNWSSISKQILLYRNDNSSITISSWNSTDMYTLLSQQAHTSYSALLHMSYHCSNFKKYDRSATLLQLYELTSSLINSYIQLFHIDHSIFTQDEINLLSEFYSLFSAKPNDFFTQKKPNI